MKNLRAVDIVEINSEKDKTNTLLAEVKTDLFFG
jgi:hypothetical protein